LRCAISTPSAFSFSAGDGERERDAERELKMGEWTNRYIDVHTGISIAIDCAIADCRHHRATAIANAISTATAIATRARVAASAIDYASGARDVGNANDCAICKREQIEGLR
jgi:hypothetical protein